MKDIFRANPENGEAQKTILSNYAQALTNQDLMSNGIDNDAEIQNKEIIATLEKELPKALANYENDIYAIYISGSRTVGLSKIASDIDIAVISSDVKTYGQIVVDIIQKLLKDKLGIVNLPVDVFSSISLELDLPEDPAIILNAMEYQESLSNSLFGREIYSNPNMKLYRLLALEALELFDEIDLYGYNEDTGNYNLNYLGDRMYIIKKISDRLNLNMSIVEKYITVGVMKKRYEKFGINPRKILSELRNWYKKEKNQIKKYKMFEVYHKGKSLLS